MAYAIMRTSKLKSIGAISSCEKHNERKRETLNADKERKNLNVTIIGDKDKSYVESFKDLTKDIKIRKNAVLGIEVFVSASPEAEFWKSNNLIKNWAIDSTKWLKDSFGKDNVVKCKIHLDETTPHIHAFIVPIYDGKLNCKKFLGGRDKLRALQTSYHKTVEKYGLKRGIEGSKAKHQDIKKFYTSLNQHLDKELPKPKLLESKDKYRDRANIEYQKLNMQKLDIEEKVKRFKQVKVRKKKFSIENLLKENEDSKIIAYLDKNQPERKKMVVYKKCLY